MHLALIKSAFSRGRSVFAGICWERADQLSLRLHRPRHLPHQRPFWTAASFARSVPEVFKAAALETTGKPSLLGEGGRLSPKDYYLKKGDGISVSCYAVAKVNTGLLNHSKPCMFPSRASGDLSRLLGALPSWNWAIFGRMSQRIPPCMDVLWCDQIMTGSCVFYVIG